MNNEQKKFRVVTKIKLCNYLLNKGFNFIETRVDYKCPSRYVWVFEYSDKLVKTIDEYYLERK